MIVEMAVSVFLVPSLHTYSFAEVSDKEAFLGSPFSGFLCHSVEQEITGYVITTKIVACGACCTHIHVFVGTHIVTSYHNLLAMIAQPNLLREKN